MANSFYWHDYETFGINPSRDRPSQFAGLRTDEDLNPIGDPLVIYCQPQKDILPSPQACLITGITPQKCMEYGLPEPQFIEAIHKQLSFPGTCGVGYNSIRFDDEVTRYALYRNFFDPYEREWKNGNSRWDILDMLRLTRALRPEGIEWPDHKTGSPSFKLEHLTVANGIAHENAHDALSDVTATIAMAKLVKEKQPRLFDYVVNHRSKRVLSEMLNLRERKPFFHISGMLSSNNMFGALMMPLIQHPTNNNSIICVDLSFDPEALIDLDADEISYRVFTPNQLLRDDQSRIPLKEVHLNKAPVVTTNKLIDSEVAERLNISLERCDNHWHRLNNIDLSKKLQAVYAERSFPKKLEAEQCLYDNFMPKSDRLVLEEVRKATEIDFKERVFHFSDGRYNQLLQSYRSRYFSGSLSDDECYSWIESCRWRLYNDESGYLTVPNLVLEVALLKEKEDLSSYQLCILDDLLRWTEAVDNEFSSTN